MNLSKDLSEDKELFSGTIVKENINKIIYIKKIQKNKYYNEFIETKWR
jgi:hypothetical protein